MNLRANRVMSVAVPLAMALTASTYVNLQAPGALASTDRAGHHNDVGPHKIPDGGTPAQSWVCGYHNGIWSGFEANASTAPRVAGRPYWRDRGWHGQTVELKLLTEGLIAGRWHLAESAHIERIARYKRGLVPLNFKTYHGNRHRKVRDRAALRRASAYRLRLVLVWLRPHQGREHEFPEGHVQKLITHYRSSQSEFHTPYCPRYHNDRWTPMRTGKQPPPLGGASMTYDARHHQLVMFGGRGSSYHLSRTTWIWNGRTWSKKRVRTSPPARTDASMAYDAKTHQVVLFGGRTNRGDVSDTWIWNGSRWSKFPGAAEPSPREHAAMAYDPKEGRIVLFGGANSSASVDTNTWTWTGRGWSLRSPRTRPPASSGPSMAYDGNELIMFGAGGGASSTSQTWAWKGSNWVLRNPRQRPPILTQPSMAYDSTTHRLVLFGGYGGSTVSYEQHDFGLTWVWNGKTWSRQRTVKPPSRRDDAAMTYDAARREVVLFGGERFEGPALGDTWVG